MHPDFWTIDPDALADAGLHADLESGLGEPVEWRAGDANRRLSALGPEALIKSWQAGVGQSSSGIRLAVTGVEVTDAWPTITRLREASGVDSVFLVDVNLSPFPVVEPRLRVGVLAGSPVVGSLREIPMDITILEDPSETCDVLILDGSADVAKATSGGFEASIVLALAPDEWPGADELESIGVASARLSASMWAVADHGLPETLRNLVEAAANGLPLDVAVSKELALVVAHPMAVGSADAESFDWAQFGGAEAFTEELGEPRYVGAQVYDQAGVRRRHAFRPGTRHDISVRIGPHDDQWLQSGEIDERLLRWTEDGAAVDVFLTVVLSTGMLTTPRKPLVLPRQGMSREISFPVDVPADQDTLLISINVYQEQRLVQVLDLRGPVREDDLAIDGTEISMTRGELQPITAETGWRRPFDASLSFHAGTDGEALVMDRERAARLDTGLLQRLQEELTSLLRNAVGADAAFGSRAGSEQQTTLLRSLARYGQGFYRELARQGFADLSQARYLQVVTAAKDIAWPIETVYDRGYPSSSARLCSRWREALTTGRCGCRKGSSTEERRVVCPLGFWGIRMIIERRMLGGATATEGRAAFQTNPRPDRHTLRPVDSVLFAAKHGTVSAADRDRMRNAYRDRLGLRVDEATSWRQWRALVRAQAPPLLVLLSHSTITDNARALQIGRRSEVLVGAVGPNYVVRPDAPDGGPGPLVMLLGCNTAISELPWQEPVSQFRAGFAAVVVGTVVETLGNQAADAACEIAAAMSGGPSSFGDVMRRARRELLAKGLAIAFSVVAFGDADWDVPARASA